MSIAADQPFGVSVVTAGQKSPSDLSNSCPPIRQCNATGQLSADAWKLAAAVAGSTSGAACASRAGAPVCTNDTGLLAALR
jgi:hypothetical protein